MTKSNNTDVTKNDETKEAIVPSQVTPATENVSETEGSVEEPTMLDRAKGFFKSKRKIIVTGAATVLGAAVVILLTKKGYTLDQSVDSSNDENIENEGGEENSI